MNPEFRLLFSATPEEVKAGETSDIYFHHTLHLLKEKGLEQTPVIAEIFPSRSGFLCGTQEALTLLRGLPLEVWAQPEGTEFQRKDTLMRISGPYGAFALYETALLGILASSSGWATAARECKLAAGGKPLISFGARHIHPAIAPTMDRAAWIGGADGMSTPLGAKLADLQPSGTMPHSLILIEGDTVQAGLDFDRTIPENVPRIVLADTFHDEAEESLRVAQALGERLFGVRLDTPHERGGVTIDLVHEVRLRLDQAGFPYVKIFVSGSLDPDRIRLLAQAGADAFGVGSYISSARPIETTMDLKVVNGRPVAKRGRIPGLIANPMLERVM